MPERTEQSDPSAGPGVADPAATAAQAWWERSSVVPPASTARLGLQGKLIICFMLLLLIAMCGSYWLFLRETRADALARARASAS